MEQQRYFKVDLRVVTDTLTKKVIREEIPVNWKWNLYLSGA